MQVTLNHEILSPNEEKLVIEIKWDPSNPIEDARIGYITASIDLVDSITRLDGAK